MNSSQIKVPASFFRKALADYANWRWAFVREVIQNSYDAGATRINFTVEPTVTSQCKVTVADNGKGMSISTLQDVFLCLGGSDKTGSDVGSFGVAKLVIAFGQIRYEIASGNYMVIGSGGDYKIEPTSHGYIKGVTLTSWLDTSFSSMMYEIRRYINMMFPDRDIDCYLNGTLIAQDVTEYDFDDETSLGTIWFNDEPTAEYSQLVVAVHGLPMFESSWNLTANFKGILNLNGDYTWFTSNRDGLTHSKQPALNNVIFKLQTERTSLKLGAQIKMVLNPIRSMASSDPKHANFKYHATNEEEGAEEHKIADKFAVVDWSEYPSNFVLSLAKVKARKTKGSDAMSANEIVKTMRLKNTQLLAHTWKVAVESVLETKYLKQLNKPAIGFIFDPSVEGIYSPTSYMVAGYTSHVLCNPTMLPEDWYIGDMVDLAIHECTHMLNSPHDEKFTWLTDAIRLEHRRMFDENDLLARSKLLLKQSRK